MISKEMFCNTIKLLVNKNEAQMQLVAAFSELCPTYSVDVFIYDDIISGVLNLLCELFGDEDDLIGKFLYGEPTPVETTGELYDLLVLNLDKKKKEPAVDNVDFDEPGLGAVGLLDD